MRNRSRGLQALTRTLDALERELLDAGDVDVLAAAAELGLKPDMQGSIALAGVTVLVPKVGQRESAGRTTAPSRRRGAVLRSPKE